ncbi:MAG TPA: amidase family protein, partial [Amycolatopsis sp.]|nr:amidase family protein [Amycolatopsis sp.]
MLNRRRFLKLAGITALATAAPRIPLAFGGDEAEHGGLLHLTATEAVRHISEGSLSAETYARALLAQAERLNFLDTIISIDPDAVLEAAHQVDMARRRGRRLGPLAGLPLLVKDNIDTKALPTTAGTPGLLSNRPTADAPVLNPLFQAGALLFAKANMHELAFGITSHNYHFGAVHNPYDATLIPGGSSGGTGAGIAARLCPAGVGTDT